MYNKIASIILNSGRNNNYTGEVFVSQPDANKERLAGKIFVLAEIEGKKSDTQKIINFLVNFFDYNYYGDEKILLRDRVDDFKIGDIFEGVLAKVNKGFLDFLETERLRIEPENTNLTLGVIYEDKLYFSNYGKNKAFLIYRRKGDYEIINIESNISDEPVVYGDDDLVFSTKVFSAVINGEIPPYSYFLFTNEALPEYLSNKDLVSIITKLPPMVAAEQIKNILQKINSYAPFLGVIIKSTLGNINKESVDDRERVLPANRLASDVANSPNSRNAHSSIYHLNYTEQKTEEMLAPAGVISFKKVAKDLADFFSALKPKKREKKRVFRHHDEDEDLITTPPAQDKSSNLNLARKDSFIIKEKIFFKRKQTISFSKINTSLKNILIVFSSGFWSGFYRSVNTWFKTLGRNGRLLVVVLLFSFVVLVISIFSTISLNKSRQIELKFTEALAAIEDKKTQIDSYLLYNNDSAALSVLNDATILINSVATNNKDQEERKSLVMDSLSDLSDRIQKISRLENFEEVLSFSALGQDIRISNLSFLNNKLYLASDNGQKIYVYNIQDSSKKELAVSADYLSSPSVYNSSIYYLAGDKIITIKDEEVSQVNNIGEKRAKDDTLTQIYYGNLYLLSKKDNQIYRFTGFSSPVKWLKEEANLSAISDFKIDVSIIFAQKNSEILKFTAGKNDNFKTDVINPPISADKILMAKDGVYILDLDNNRLVNFNKEGKLIKQFRLLKEGVVDFAIDEDSKSVYLLTNQAVFKTAL